MNKISKNILLTFDYELFLGKRTGTVEKCLLEPTEALRSLLNKHQAKGIFFIDILCLIQFQNQPELQTALKSVIHQLQTLSKEGHYIFPHIHPHWQDAVYLKENKQFDLSNLHKYSLANCDKKEIEALFSKSIAFLKEHHLAQENYGYRAGGWCMQPFSLFRETFLKNNILFDFSVLPGYKNENPTQAFDYSRLKSQNPYTFSEIIEEKNAHGEFTEFPISTISVNNFVQLKDKLTRKYLWKTGDKGSGDGLSAQTEALKSRQKNEMVSIDVLTAAKLNTYKIFLKNNAYMHWISHPKMFTKHALNCFSKFMGAASQNYSCEYDFKNMSPN